MKLPLDPEFTPSALVARIVRGAIDDDPVRLHGAIVAVLELDGPDLSQTQVFAVAVGIARDRCVVCGDAVAEAIEDHLAEQRRSAPVPA
jgi:hypothetical protein